MKKAFLTLGLASLFFISCSSDDEATPTSTSSTTTTSSDTTTTTSGESSTDQGEVTEEGTTTPEDTSTETEENDKTEDQQETPENETPASFDANLLVGQWKLKEVITSANNNSIITDCQLEKESIEFDNSGTYTRNMADSYLINGTNETYCTTSSMSGATYKVEDGFLNITLTIDVLSNTQKFDVKTLTQDSLVMEHHSNTMDIPQFEKSIHTYTKIVPVAE